MATTLPGSFYPGQGLGEDDEDNEKVEVEKDKVVCIPFSISGKQANTGQSDDIPKMNPSRPLPVPPTESPTIPTTIVKQAELPKPPVPQVPEGKLVDLAASHDFEEIELGLEDVVIIDHDLPEEEGWEVVQGEM